MKEEVIQSSTIFSALIQAMTLLLLNGTAPSGVFRNDLPFSNKRWYNLPSVQVFSG